MKFIGIITSDEASFKKVKGILEAIIPKKTFQIIESPVVVEAEADTINLFDGLLIRVEPDYVMPDFCDVDVTIEEDIVKSDMLYYSLEKIVETKIMEEYYENSKCKR